MEESNIFKFYVPFEIEKAKDEHGNEVMKIAGIASTTDTDSDGEVLDPSGFDLSYFTKNGFINWHHQSKDKPEAIIGEPTKAEIRNEGLYVEGVLYNDSKIAHQVYDLAKNLEKSKSKRRLGFSIEGKATERGSDDENSPLFKRILKAKITGLAVTPTPKNAATLVDIIKGRRFTEFEPEIVELESTLDANGGNTLIIDITKPNGERITVDSNYNIKVLSKATDTANAGILSPVDVEGKLKVLQNDAKISENSDKEKQNIHKFVQLNKSILFNEILKATDDFELTNKIVKSINTNTMAKEIKLDELVKALQDIGISVDETELLKSKDEKPENIEDNKFLDKKEDAAEDKKEKEKKDDDDDDDEIEKAIKEKEAELEDLKLKKAAGTKKVEDNSTDKKEDLGNDKLPDTDKVDPKELKKVEDRADYILGKKEKTEIKKADTFDIEKGISDITGLIKSFTSQFEERLQNLENQPGVRKSVVKAHAIEKSFGGPDDENNKGKTTLSVSRNRQQVSNILLSKSGIEKGELNNFYADAMQAFEATGTLSKAVVTDLYTNNNILITD